MVMTRSQMLAQALQNNTGYQMGQGFMQQGMQRAYSPGQAIGNAMNTALGLYATKKARGEAEKTADDKSQQLAKLLTSSGINVPQGQDPADVMQLAMFKKQLTPDPVDTFEVVDNPYGKGGFGQKNARTGQIVGYQPPEKQTAETWGNTMEVSGPDGNPMLVQVSNMGNTRPVEGYGPKAEAPKPPTIKTIFDDATGLRQTVQWNPEVSEWQPIGGVEAPNGMTVSVGADGEVTLVQGPGASSAKPMTEQQSKDAVYYTRAKGALETFEKVASEMTSATNRALDLDSTGMIRRFQDENFQVAQAAGREFLAAFLRKDTGAAVTEAEMQQYGSIYIPSPGDSDQVLEYKREARQRALNAIRAGMAPQAIMNAEMALRTGGKPQPDKTLSADNTQMIPDEINAGGWGVKELE